MKIKIINGPNLNLLGVREVEIYGKTPFEKYFEVLQKKMPQVHLEYFQSNHEGFLIDKLHETGFSYDGIILNPGGYTHVSIALADAISAITTPVIEVHISNIYGRETYQWSSYTAGRCKGIIAGMGLQGYKLAIDYFLMEYNK